MIELDPYRSDLNINPDTNEYWVELRAEDNTLAARIRYTPSAPEATATEFTIDPAHTGIGKQLVIQMLEEMKNAGCATARLVHILDPAPFIKYECQVIDGDALVDLNGPTLDLLKASLS